MGRKRNKLNLGGRPCLTSSSRACRTITVGACSDPHNRRRKLLFPSLKHKLERTKHVLPYYPASLRRGTKKGASPSLFEPSSAPPCALRHVLQGCFQCRSLHSRHIRLPHQIHHRVHDLSEQVAPPPTCLFRRPITSKTHLAVPNTTTFFVLRNSLSSQATTANNQVQQVWQPSTKVTTDSGANLPNGA